MPPLSSTLVVALLLCILQANSFSKISTQYVMHRNIRTKSTCSSTGRSSLDVAPLSEVDKVPYTSVTELSKHETLKLPVWPVWSGVIAQIFDWIGAFQVSEWIQSTIGGRVIPISLNEFRVSPFLLLVHHSHSFTPLDPFRAITKLLLPEGFPAHPHAGFDTVTYCIDGGLAHRDSEAFKMSYGDGDIQWMRAGKGVIHEEMWDLQDADWSHKRIGTFNIYCIIMKALLAIIMILNICYHFSNY